MEVLVTCLTLQVRPLRTVRATVQAILIKTPCGVQAHLSASGYQGYCLCVQTAVKVSAACVLAAELQLSPAAGQGVW